MSLYPIHDRVIAQAKRELGVAEHPAGSNSGSRVRQYQAATFLGGSGWPWCAAFCCWCWREAGRPLPYRTASAYGMLNWARGAGWARSSSQLVPGDLVVFNVGSGHIGIFERWEGSTIHTIDGNHNNMVARAARPHSSVAGGIHVPEQPTQPKRPVSEPFWVIATSESGHRQLLFTKFATEAKVLNKILPPLIRKYGKAGLTITRGGVRKRKR
jgi:CHAP domain-containing protein